MEKFVISDYLVELDRKKVQGRCKRCQKLVTWSKERVAAHIRASCTDATEDEKRKFAKRASSV